MANKSKNRQSESERRDGFYEMMPGYMDSYELFPAESEDEMGEEASEEEVRRRMVRQLMLLVGLLLIQFVLFAVLMQSTINLG
jgi:hypothetical protein